MRKKLLSISTVAILSVTMLAGCGKVTETLADSMEEVTETEIVEEIETETEVEEVETEVVEPETETEVEEVETETKVEEPVATKPVEPAPAPTVEPTPEPTTAPATPVHTHNYTLTSSTSGANCSTAGTDTYTCECGDSYTQANGSYGDHTWTTETTTEKIWHDQVTERGFRCYCGQFFTDESDPHLQDECSGYTTESRVVSPEYEEVIEHEHTYCTSCGAEK